MSGHIIAKAIALSIGLLLAAPASANVVPKEVRSQLAKAEQIGKVQVRFLGIRMYSAALFTKGGSPFDWGQPFALELKYTRSFGRDRLVKASISELERLEGKRADHAAIASKLQSCYRSVKSSDRFVAIPQGRNGLSFFFNGRQTCNIRHSGIRERLLGIWLSDRSRNVGLSRSLRGLK